MKARKQTTNLHGASDTRFVCWRLFPEKEFRMEREKIVLVTSEMRLNPDR